MLFRTGRRRAAAIVAILLTLIVGLYAARTPILAGIGRQLVRADPLTHADAIVVLAGGTPQREIEAADLYLAGWAPRVLMTVEHDSEAAEVLRQRGIPFETQIELRRRILHSIGVPDSSVTMLDQSRATSTKMETDLVKDWVVANSARRIIVVTSPFHTARASLIFRRSLRDQGTEVLARPASHEAFEPNGWWRHRQQLRNGFFEWQKLLFYYVAYR